MADYDVIVIGAGPGGYVCAIRCAQLGLKTACAEGRETLGGTCLNVGCIPSKAMLYASELYHQSHTNFEKMGLMGGAPKVDLARMLEYKGSTVENNTKGIEFLFKKNKVDWLKGWASIAGPNAVDVDGTVHKAKSIVISTGSEASPLKGAEVDEKVVVTSTGALELAKLPKRLAVIGAGVIGLELGSVYARLGSEVTVLEYLDQITPGMDLEVCKTFQRMLGKQGLKIVLGAAVQGVEAGKGEAKVAYRLRKDDSAAELDADVVLVATGRRPFTMGLGLERAGVEVNERGQVSIDAHWRTSVAGIYALGDVVAGPMLAHKAEDEGIAVAENIAGLTGIVNHEVIPSVVYTMPEIAGVGVTEEQAKEQGEVKVGKFPMLANSRAKTNHEPDGFVKVIADAKTDRVLGVWCIASVAGTMIAQAAQAMEFGATSEDIAYTCHAHPTHSEALKEAAMAVTGNPIHI